MAGDLVAEGVAEGVAEVVAEVGLDGRADEDALSHWAANSPLSTLWNAISEGQWEVVEPPVSHPLTLTLTKVTIIIVISQDKYMNTNT